jgi:uncharacterized protein YcnI
MTSSLPRRLARGLAVASFGLAIPIALAAHAVVYPRTSATSAYERYVLRVPNEKATATTRVELRFPEGLRVTSFADVPGWTIEVLTDSAHRIVGAVWTGTLPPQRFVELPFVAANPKRTTTLVWPAIQLYADGQRVEWTGAPDSRTPASVTTIEAGAGGAVRGAAGWVAWVALALGLVSLGLTLRRPSAA